MYYYGGQPSYQQQLQQTVGFKGRPVSGIEEARVAQIDFDGSLFVFPDVANKKIYTKQINLDGTASMKVYNLVDDTPPAPTYVTRNELDSILTTLKQSFSNGKEKENAKQSVNEQSKFTTGSNNAALSF